MSLTSFGSQRQRGCEHFAYACGWCRAGHWLYAHTDPLYIRRQLAWESVILPHQLLHLCCRIFIHTFYFIQQGTQILQYAASLLLSTQQLLSFIFCSSDGCDEIEAGPHSDSGITQVYCYIQSTGAVASESAFSHLSLDSSCHEEEVVEQVQLLIMAMLLIKNNPLKP